MRSKKSVRLLARNSTSQADRFPVKYEQMRAIYKNERIPFVGSFVAFMQSPVGYMSMILVAIAMIATPIMEKKMEKATAERLAILLPPPPAPIDPFAHLKGAENNKTFAERLAEQDDLTAEFAVGFEEDRIHADIGVDAAGFGLNGLNNKALAAELISQGLLVITAGTDTLRLLFNADGAEIINPN